MRLAVRLLVLYNPMRYMDPSGHVIRKRVSFGHLSYETVQGTPNSEFVDANGVRVYTDANGVMYRITADGYHARLFKTCVGTTCKYGYEGDPAVDEFINNVDQTIDRVTGVAGDFVSGGVLGGCVVGMVATGPGAPIGCGAGAILGGASGAIGAVVLATLYYSGGVAEGEELMEGIRDTGKPLPVYGPPRPPKVKSS
jgi:hypothetical protein